MTVSFRVYQYFRQPNKLLSTLRNKDVSEEEHMTQTGLTSCRRLQMKEIFITLNC